MSFMYFRFYLAESKAYEEKERVKILESYRLIFETRKDLGFIRASFDLTSTDKSISILSESDADIEIEKRKLAKIFTEKQDKSQRKYRV